MYDKYIQDKMNSLFKLFISKNNSAQGVQASLTYWYYMDISYDTKSLISWTCIYDYHRSMQDKLFYQMDFEYFVQGMLSEVKSSIQVRMRYVAVKKNKTGILRICVHVRTTYADQKNNRYRFIH